jgi:hypothetical protein
MSSETESAVAEVRAALALYKQELAMVLTGVQTARDRKQRRDLARRLDACKRRARVLARDVEGVLTRLEDGHEARPELETAAGFLVKMQELGNAPASAGA